MENCFIQYLVVLIYSYLREKWAIERVKRNKNERKEADILVIRFTDITLDTRQWGFFPPKQMCIEFSASLFSPERSFDYFLSTPGCVLTRRFSSWIISPNCSDPLFHHPDQCKNQLHFQKFMNELCSNPILQHLHSAQSRCSRRPLHAPWEIRDKGLIGFLICGTALTKLCDVRLTLAPYSPTQVQLLVKRWNALFLKGFFLAL